MNNRAMPIEIQALRKIMGGGLIWLVAAVVVLAIFFFTTIRVGRVTGEQVGIILNKLSGKISVINQSGVRIYNGITNDFFVLDKTLQTLEMTEVAGRGDRRGKDDLKIKTIDGSDVYVDLKVQYRLNPEMADMVITTSGPGDRFKRKWARAYLRAITRNFLGELTTEEFYDASKRNVKILQAKQDANERLNPFGIIIDSIVIPKKPHFYEEYEEMIKKKKLADQGVLEEQSKALAAKQRQLRILVEERNKMNVAIEQFEGQMEQRIIAEKAETEKVTKRADGYHNRVTVGAGAALYQRTKNAEGILALKKAEAQGIEAMKKAMEGEGGRNMVKMEYAKRLKNVSIIGKPFTIQSSIERFEHLKGPASTGRE